MTHSIQASPEEHEISVAFTFYDNFSQAVKRAFFLRNLSGNTVEEQLTEAKTLMHEVAAELHYITGAGLDKAEIKVGNKKVDKVVFTTFTPPSKERYFRYGINMGFSGLNRWMWELNGRRVRQISQEKLSEGWHRQIVKEISTASFRLPCFVDFSAQIENPRFIRYIGDIKRNRRIISWQLQYNYHDEVLNRFTNRFHEFGHLSLGQRKYWAAADSGYLQIKGVFWKAPEFKPSSLPRKKSRIANQPKDNTEYVYLIQMGQYQIYKIGKSNDPQGRLASLQSANLHKLKLIHTFQADNASAAEEVLHAELHDQRMEGEWFSLTQKQKKAIISVSEFKAEHFLISQEIKFTVKELFGIED